MKYRVSVIDEQTDSRSNNIILVKKRTSLVTVALKGLEAHLEKNLDSENEETLKLAKAIKRESNDELETFLEEVSSDLDYLIHIAELNNHTYKNVRTGETKTSNEVGKQSFYNAWLDQRDEGEKDFLKYLPDAETVVEHGNELMFEDIEEGDWEIVEEED